MNGRFKKACALFASLVVLSSSAIAMVLVAPAFVAPAAAAGECENGCSFGFGPPVSPLAGTFELGLEFYSEVAGTVFGVCYHQQGAPNPAEGGNHQVHLWTTGGTLLATGNGIGVPGQENCFSLNTPIQIGANQSVVASYGANTQYAYNNAQFPVQVGVLHAVQGRYSNAGGLNTFPSNLTNNGYGVDIQFFNGTPKLGGCNAVDVSGVTAPSALSSAPGPTYAVVSWAPSYVSDDAASMTADGCIAGYIVTPSLDGVAQTPVFIAGHGTTTVLRGLLVAGSYTFTVAAWTGQAAGPESEATGPITVGTPTAPGAIRASRAGKGAVRVSFKASNGNGSGVSKYTATCKSGGKSRAKSGKSSPITVTGLGKGKATCTVRGTNARGNGPPSKAVKA